MEQIDDLKKNGLSTEQALDYLVDTYNILLHGSRVNIENGIIRPNYEGEVFGADVASIAFISAIFSNRELVEPGLSYPYNIDEDNPLVLKIHGLHKNTIGKEGFIYLIEDKTGFVNDPKSSWQYIKTGSNVPFTEKIKVYREDFNYPIYDAIKGTQIQ